MRKPVRIGIAGTRGIPAKYGGFETFAQEISVGLAKNGSIVTVYCENNSIKPTAYGRVLLKYLPIKKSTNQPVYFWLSLWRALHENDVVIVTSTGAAYFYLLNKVFYRRKIITNTDGVESRRSKWSYLEKMYLRYSEYFAVRLSDAIVADALGIADYLYKNYEKMSPVNIIEYGAFEIKHTDNSYRNYGVEDGKYLLIVARLEPENNILMMLEGYCLSNIEMPLLVVGNIQSTDYVTKLQEFTGKKVRFLNGIYDKEKLNSLRVHAFAYLHGHSVGGTNPSLLEAMGCGSICICHDNNYNREVTNHNMFYFSDATQLAALLTHVLKLSHLEIETKKQLAIERINTYYNWDKILEKYEKLISKLLLS
jgi:glycosyltransferase involved in cell wall biosynthesis